MEPYLHSLCIFMVWCSVKSRDNFTYFILFQPRRLTNLWASTACYRDIFAFLYRSKNTLASGYIYCFSKRYMYRRNSSLGIATGYELDDRGVGVRFPVGARIFSSPRHPDRLWGPSNLLSNGCRGPLPRG
jgi:hypothetical protein